MSKPWQMVVSGCDDSVTLSSYERPSAEVVAFAKQVNIESKDRCQPNIRIYRVPQGHTEWRCQPCGGVACQEVEILAGYE